MTPERKADLLSDYHKDFYGYRPDREWLATASVEDKALAFDNITAVINDLKSTPENRATLRKQGWEVK